MRKRQQQMTRKAILRALGEVVAESGAHGFSIQQVADRAGVTHRTVYNHFPTREVLNDAFAEHVEEELGTVVPAAPDEGDRAIDDLPAIVAEAYRMFAKLDAPSRAYVMLMLATRAPAKLTRARTERMERVLERDAGPLPEGAARLVMAALRMFLSTTGWHLLTEHYGLSTGQAAATARWVCSTLLAAVREGNLPTLESVDESDDDD